MLRVSSIAAPALILYVVTLLPCCHDARQRTDASTIGDTIRLPAVNLREDGDKATGVILVTVDTLRADYLSCYGHTRVLTPAMDRFASMGVRFASAYSQA